jgi:hypothetical protein
MAGPDYQAILDDFEADLAPLDKQRDTIISSINYFRAKANMPPRPEGGGNGGGVAAAPANGKVSLASDQFVGKRLRSATNDDGDDESEETETATTKKAAAAS